MGNTFGRTRARVARSILHISSGCSRLELCAAGVARNSQPIGIAKRFADGSDGEFRAHGVHAPGALERHLPEAFAGHVQKASADHLSEPPSKPVLPATASHLA